ncbi:MAG TPA: membrane protein insertase YidC [Cytophagales bacterium]|nr:membrane protein insertase YidC [Cytophagales bacterium]
MDRNSTIGLILIGIILFSYFTFYNKPSVSDQPKAKPKKEQIQAQKDSTELKAQNSFSDSSYNTLPSKDVILENDKIKVVISSQGAFIKAAELKEHKDYRKNQLVLLDEPSFDSKLVVQTQYGDVDLNTLNYASASESVFVKDQDSGSVVLETSIKGQKVSQVFSLKKGSYLLHRQIDFKGLPLKTNVVGFDFTNYAKRTEADPKISKTQTTVNFYGTEFGSLSETSTDKEQSEVTNAKWFAFKSKFFLIGVIPDVEFSKLQVNSVGDPNDTSIIKTLNANGAFAVQGGKTGFQYYLGPNHYQTCKKITEGFGNNVYLGWPVFNAINKFIIIPIFNFLESIFSNYGIIILVLVLIVKLALFPLSYKSYLSMAKIKVLKPELDEIKARVGDDMQAQQQEQMKLYQSVGVNPLAGCIPVLLQMPILLAMFNFFPNAIELRHKSFLWADDLSIYDTFVKLPFSIPFGYGDHVSLFTILMTVATLVNTWYTSQMQASMSGPMKYMQYVMPIIFLFVLNSMSAGLTYYYFISTVFTIVQQFIIKSRVDETKIREKLDSYKKGVKEGTHKKSRWQQRLEDAIKAQEEAKKNKKK